MRESLRFIGHLKAMLFTGAFRTPQRKHLSCPSHSLDKFAQPSCGEGTQILTVMLWTLGQFRVSTGNG